MLRKNTVKLLQESKHFCVLPWIHFHSWPNSNVMPCCVADSEKPVAKINSEESILEMMNSEGFKKLRRNMLEDKPSDECKRCYDLEGIGTWTMRQSHNTRRGNEYIPLIDATKLDGSIPEFKMRYMDIRFSNLCNMKCRSCGPACSSQWAEEYSKEKGADQLEKHFGMKKFVINSNEDQKFMAKLKPYLKDVTEVYFAGGEVVITPEHYECLEYWIENGLTDKIELTYTTNFSVLKYKSKDLIKLWKHFPKVKVWASLDSEGATAELMRKGTDWEKILKNIRKLRQEAPHVIFQITPTISIWNVFSFPDFFDKLMDEGLLSTEENPRVNVLTWPWYAHIMILPKPVKDKLRERYKKSIDKYKDNKDLANSLAMIRYTLRTGEPNKEGILEFIKYNDEVDKARNENILEVIPELKEVYEWAKS